MKKYKKFEHKECEYYPCHNLEDMNCLFCFCPLYFAECNGNFKLTPKGIKDCSNCIKPHTKEGYDYIQKEIKRLNAK